jgi:hypothetical protein
VFQKRGDVRQFEEGIKKAFSKVKDEFSEHLLAINENTNEVQANYEYLCELDAKIQKLAERMDELALFVRHPSVVCGSEYEVAELTNNEREVFMALYTLINERGKATYADLCRRCGMPEGLVQTYVTNLIAKGVPVHKRYNDKEVLLIMDKAFCELQAKENIVHTNELISEKVISQ